MCWMELWDRMLKVHAAKWDVEGLVVVVVVVFWGGCLVAPLITTLSNQEHSQSYSKGGGTWAEGHSRHQKLRRHVSKWPESAFLGSNLRMDWWDKLSSDLENLHMGISDLTYFLKTKFHIRISDLTSSKQSSTWGLVTWLTSSKQGSMLGLVTWLTSAKQNSTLGLVTWLTSTKHHPQNIGHGCAPDSNFKAQSALFILILPLYKRHAPVLLHLPVTQESTKSLKTLFVLHTKMFEMTKPSIRSPMQVIIFKWIDLLWM